MIKNNKKYKIKNNKVKEPYREVIYNEYGKVISYEGVGMFEDFNLRIDKFHKTLSLGCSFVDYDINDNVRNRRIKLTKKNALYLVKDLIIYIITGKV